ncbi:apolipoprotein N-acyltransferase [Flavobacteriaceae bacterium]|nr:apolipoprotein N-acyltransferase [Flavobacteriaceae bacterium]
MSKTTKYFLLAIGSGILLSASWPVNGITLLVFVGLVPLLFLEDSIRKDDLKKKGIRVFLYSYLTFIIWNALTTWWLVNSTFFGMLFANLCNSLFYALVFLCFSWTKGRMADRSGYLFFIALWIAFEKLHLEWDFSWTWLTLGNVFSEKFYWIQWYEYTGVYGGSLWVLIINVWIFSILRKHELSTLFKTVIKKLIGPLLLIALPIAGSLYLYQQVADVEKNISVALIQPNIDPYSTKYQLTNSTFLSLWEEQTKPFINDSLDYILSPETYFAEGFGEELKGYPKSILHQDIQKELAKIPETQFISGVQYYDVYTQEEAPSLTANLARKGLWVEYYNSAVAEQFNSFPQVYHKSKLVVGVENMPLKSVLNPLLGDLMLDLGGTVASRVTQNKRSVFTHPNLKEKAAPIICWESIFGEFVTGYVKEGATFLAVISNDAWWGNTPGHKQLLSYTRLRAIETRRDIARSANTGISCIIDARGEILKQTTYNSKTVLIGKISSRDTITFYVRFGDIIARWAGFITVLFFLLALSGRLKEKDTL